MKIYRLLNDEWSFTKQDGHHLVVNIPHTWNIKNTTDSSKNYFRGVCVYSKDLGPIKIDRDEDLALEFKGVCSSCDVYFNNFLLGHHDGGYSSFRFIIDQVLIHADDNTIKVVVDNSCKDTIYPIESKFTIYGGIYREVNLLTLNKNHFDIVQNGGIGAIIDSYLNNKLGVVDVKPLIVGKGTIQLTLLDADGNEVNKVNDTRIEIINPHLWNGILDPYLYTLKIQLINSDKVCDEIIKKIGFKNYSFDSRKGFYLNDQPYSLVGVSYHSGRLGSGSVVTKEQILEDFEIIKATGATSIKLPYYQHDDFILDCCDQYGIIAQVEIPLIEKYDRKANANAIEQLKEMIYQSRHHTSILTWSLANNVSTNKSNMTDLIDLIKVLNSVCKQEDAYRLTSLVSESKLTTRNLFNRIADITSYSYRFENFRMLNFLNFLIVRFYHLLNPSKVLFISECGMNADFNLHSELPFKNNSSEEYQLFYLNNLLKTAQKNHWINSYIISDLFDSSSANKKEKTSIGNKGLVSFDRKNKKDAYYLCKAYWSKVLFTYIVGKKYKNRMSPFTILRIISNEPELEIFINKVKFKTVKGKKYYSILIKNKKDSEIVVKGINSEDKIKLISKKENLD